VKEAMVSDSDLRDDQPRPDELKGAGYEIFIGTLSVLSIVNLVLVYAIRDDNLSTVLLWINVLLSVVFLIDFGYRLTSAESRSAYFFHQYGWADLLASLPLEQAKVLRVFRLVRVYRLLDRYGARNIVRNVLKDRAGSALLTLLLMGVLVLEFGSLAMLALEQGAAGAEIVTASDALWYVVVTISTVGYGDLVPVTNGGRILGTVIIVIGVGIFGTFTGYLANLFLAPRRQAAQSGTDDARRRVDQLRTLVTQQQAAIDDLERLLQPGV
jgi:voltage-gated potassium channel